MHTFQGRCHCGALAFTYRTPKTPEKWSVRSCQCRFCRSHAASTTSDSGGHVTFQLDPENTRRYRFHTWSADFLLCSCCGVYIAATLTAPQGEFATLNVNAMEEGISTPASTPVSYGSETVEQRLARRQERWTPVG
jgi:hypothetical protein